MNQASIHNLREAVKQSPDNVYRRLILAETLLEHKDAESAEDEFKTILNKDPENIKSKTGLARAYYEENKFSTAIIVLEEVLQSDGKNAELQILLCKALMKNNEVQKALENYSHLISKDPNLKDEELDQHLRSSHHGPVDGIIESLEESFENLEKPQINFDDVGGMANAKEEIKIKIIQPLEHPELYKKFGKKTGGGILFIESGNTLACWLPSTYSKNNGHQRWSVLTEDSPWILTA